MPQNAASHLGLFHVLIRISSKIEIDIKKDTPDDPKNETGLAEMLTMGKFICHIWVIIYGFGTDKNIISGDLLAPIFKTFRFPFFFKTVS